MCTLNPEETQQAVYVALLGGRVDPGVEGGVVLHDALYLVKSIEKAKDTLCCLRGLRMT